MTEQDRKFLEITIENSKKVAAGGNQPFASILVDKNGKIVATGENQIASEFDPT
jgi:tRNA(Arg) A34 adenosine deaminase TadA